MATSDSISRNLLVVGVPSIPSLHARPYRACLSSYRFDRAVAEGTPSSSCEHTRRLEHSDKGLGRPAQEHIGHLANSKIRQLADVRPTFTEYAVHRTSEGSGVAGMYQELPAAVQHARSQVNMATAKLLNEQTRSLPPLRSRRSQWGQTLGASFLVDRDAADAQPAIPLLRGRSDMLGPLLGSSSERGKLVT